VLNLNEAGQVFLAEYVGVVVSPEPPPWMR